MSTITARFETDEPRFAGQKAAWERVAHLWPQAVVEHQRGYAQDRIRLDPVLAAGLSELERLMLATASAFRPGSPMPFGGRVGPDGTITIWTD